MPQLVPLKGRTQATRLRFRRPVKAPSPVRKASNSRGADTGKRVARPQRRALGLPPAVDQRQCPDGHQRGKGDNDRARHQSSDHQDAVHEVVARAAQLRALERVTARLVGRELHRDRAAPVRDDPIDDIGADNAEPVVGVVALEKELDQSRRDGI